MDWWKIDEWYESCEPHLPAMLHSFDGRAYILVDRLFQPIPRYGGGQEWMEPLSGAIWYNIGVGFQIR